MTKHIKMSEKQDSLIHHNIRNAAFMPLESEKTNTFKYWEVYKCIGFVNKVIPTIKKYIKMLVGKIKILYSEFNWVLVKNDATEWFITVLLEGLTANYAMHILFGIPFNIYYIFAHGIVIIQGLSIHRRLKIDGNTTKISDKHKSK